MHRSFGHTAGMSNGASAFLKAQRVSAVNKLPLLPLLPLSRNCLHLLRVEAE